MQVPSPGDSAVIGGQKFGGQRERVPDADAQGEVQLPSERQPKERDVRNSSSHPSAVRGDFGEREVGKQVVKPLVRSVDDK